MQKAGLLLKEIKRLILLLAITALNLADFGITIYLIRTGQGTEGNPIMRTAGIALIKLLAVPFLAGLTFYTAGRAQKEGSTGTVWIIDALIIVVLIWLAFVVANNISVWAFHMGVLDLWGV
jgi:hypothetical protein